MKTFMIPIVKVGVKIASWFGGASYGVPPFLFANYKSNC